MRPQTAWLKDTSGKLAMDFIGRFEHLEHDFSVISQRLGFEDGDLPKVMMGDGSDYKSHYDQYSAEIIAKRYAEEIALFDYSFDGPISNHGTQPPPRNAPQTQKDMSVKSME